METIEEIIKRGKSACDGDFYIYIETLPNLPTLYFLVFDGDERLDRKIMADEKVYKYIKSEKGK